MLPFKRSINWDCYRCYDAKVEHNIGHMVLFGISPIREISAELAGLYPWLPN